MAKKAKEFKIARIWSLIALSFDIMLSNRSIIPWIDISFGGHFFTKLLNHLQNIGDIQTFASLICIFGGCESTYNLLSRCKSQNSSELIQMFDLHRVLIRYAELLRKLNLLDLSTEVRHLYIYIYIYI